MNPSRFAVFLVTVLTIWGLLHAYVFWRLSSIPWLLERCSRRTWLVVAIALWASYPLARFLDSRDVRILAVPLEYVAANWMGVLFLLFVTLLAADVVTLGGWLAPQWAGRIRGTAAAAGVALALTAYFQALRPPVVREHEVSLTGLPPERDGLVLVQLSDLHLGNLLGRRWLSGLVEQVNQLRPDLVVLVGDVVDGNVRRVEALQPELQQLRAPLGVWAVTGNHEFYAGADRCVKLFERAGFQVLRDRAEAVAPGLVVAGVDDLTARAQYGDASPPLEQLLRHRPSGATILLSHSPWQAETAAAAGVGLMLSGHTHNGQIWPFSYLVRRRYPLLGGLYRVDQMTAIVCRGTGTWGPRMRLWWPSEMVKITLRAAGRP
jgi:predicted MPP superfamily phosphohydrolase